MFPPSVKVDKVVIALVIQCPSAETLRRPRKGTLALGAAMAVVVSAFRERGFVDSGKLAAVSSGMTVPSLVDRKFSANQHWPPMATTG